MNLLRCYDIDLGVMEVGHPEENLRQQVDVRRELLKYYRHLVLYITSSLNSPWRAVMDTVSQDQVRTINDCHGVPN
jgi:hypothetical protein